MRELERDRQVIDDCDDLRDRFAGQAMGAMICHDTPIANCNPDYIAVCAYNFGKLYPRPQARQYRSAFLDRPDVSTLESHSEDFPNAAAKFPAAEKLVPIHRWSCPFPHPIPYPKT